MAIDITLDDIDQDQYDAAESVIIELLRSHSPELDLRRGTAIRDLVIRPAAQFHALETARIEATRNTNSLQLVVNSAEVADIDVVDGLLANVGYSRQPGEFATGEVRVNVSVLKDYFIPNQYELEDGSGYKYVTEQAWTIRKDGATDSTTELSLLPSETSSNNYYFILPMIGEVEGSQYQAEENEVMTPTGRELGGIDSFSVFKSFTGGINQESAQQAADSLPRSLSLRALESSRSIDSRLRNSFPDLIATSTIGYGDQEMLRDKHNVFGIAVGNKVDIYCRTFQAPTSVILSKTGTKVSDGVYTVTIDRGDAPGFSVIRSVTLVGQTSDGEISTNPIQLSTLNFTEVRAASETDQTYHEFATDNAVVETAFTAWQSATLTITDVPGVIVDGAGTYPDSLAFIVEAYLPPGLASIQSFIDYDGVRNLEADQVARGAVLCFVELSATVYKNPGVIVNLELMAQVLTDYINNKKFGELLTASELASVIHQFNIVRVNLDDTSESGFKLFGTIRDAGGNPITLSGNTLDISTVIDAENLVTPATTVFVADRRDIILKEIEV